MKNLENKKKDLLYLGAVLLLCLHFVLGLLSIRSKSPTFDEGVHLTGGVSYWRTGDYRINPESGIFPQKWAALPVVLNCKYPEGDKFQNEWTKANKFVYNSGNDPDRMFFQSRIMILILSVTLAFVVFLRSRKIFGNKGALISLTLYALSPTVIANARLVTADLAVSLFFILSVIAIWDMFRRITPLRFILCALALSFLFLSKFSAVISIPIFFVMMIPRVLSRKPLFISFFSKKRLRLSGRLSKLAAIIVSGFACGLVIFIAIWAAYGFRFSITPKNSSDKTLIPSWELLQENTSSALPGKVITALKDYKVLPEAFLYGALFTFDSAKERNLFLNGEYSRKGWFSFFFYTTVFKTPLPVMGILLIAIFSVWKSWEEKGYDRKPAVRVINNAMPMLTLLFVYFAFAIAAKLNLGHRHLLPICPSIFILAGASVWFLREKSRIPTILLVFLTSWLALENTKIFPNYLAYFNDIAGGPENAYKHLVDSSLDWGQDLKGLQLYLGERKEKRKTDPNENIYVSYFGTAEIKHYLPKAKILPSFFMQSGPNLFKLQPGLYCISATMLQQAYNPQLAVWDAKNEAEFQKLKREVGMLFKIKSKQAMEAFIASKGDKEKFINDLLDYRMLRFAKLCNYLRNKTPDDNIGYSILLFSLTEEDLARVSN